MILDSNKKAVDSVWSESGIATLGDDWVEVTSTEGLMGLSYIDSSWVDLSTYADKRKAKYDALSQFEMQYDDAKNSTTTWIDAIDAIKVEFPKP